MKKSKLVIILLLSSLALWACTNSSLISTGTTIYRRNSDSVFKVVIDPGHGGRDNGTTGAGGQFEKEFTLSVANRVKQLLEQEPHMQVFMTRTDDSFISQESRYRPNYANELGADFFISIHANSYSDPNVSGTETLYYHSNSRLLAQIIQKHVANATGFRNRGIRKQELFVIADTKMPSALIEVGYLTNPKDETLMWTDEFQNLVATSVVEGIKEFLARTGYSYR